MAFKIFGKVNFTPYTKVERFADELRNNKLMGTKCKKCGEIYFPPRADCTKCMSNDMEWRSYSGKGKLVTFTTIHAAPTGFDDIAPYTIGVVDLQEGGRLLAWVEGVKPEELRIGMELTAIPQIMEDIEELKVVYVLRK
jgi:uncharacterized OB-fold protein